MRQKLKNIKTKCLKSFAHDQQTQLTEQQTQLNDDVNHENISFSDSSNGETSSDSYQQTIVNTSNVEFEKYIIEDMSNIKEFAKRSNAKFVGLYVGSLRYEASFKSNICMWPGESKEYLHDIFKKHDIQNYYILKI